MDFIEIAKKRSSVRGYKDRKVEEEKLKKILEAAHVAPTAANLQPVRLIVVQSSEGLAKIGKGANLYGAPLAVIVCADHGKAWVRPFDKKQTADIDASILTDHMMLQATELGLGSRWGFFFSGLIICCPRRGPPAGRKLRPAACKNSPFLSSGTATRNTCDVSRRSGHRYRRRATPSRRARRNARAHGAHGCGTSHRQAATIRD